MKSVLIVKCGALGDVVRTTSLLPALRKACGGRIDWVTSAGAAPLLRGLPQLRSVVILGSRQTLSLRRDYDLVLSLEEDSQAAELAARCCRGELVGVFHEAGRLRYTASSAAYYDMSLLAAGGLEEADRLKAANKLTYAELWLEVLGLPVGKSGAPRPLLSLSRADRRPASELARRHRFARRPIGFNPGAGARWPSKQLSEERSAELLRALSALGRPLLLLGGADEEGRNRRIAGALPPGAVVRHEPVDVRAFAGLLELCAAVVVTDSLALHLAGALRRPAVVLIGPTSAAELDVFGAGEKLSPSGGCGCFYQPRCRRRRHCLDSIPSRAVVAAVSRCLS